MKVTVNGRVMKLDEGATVKGLLRIEGIEEPRGVAVAVDGCVVARGEWAVTFLQDGQRVEILRAVQGG
ncbi:MAG: sulfur carrier protein ThiS [Actinomycetota bacterium]